MAEVLPQDASSSPTIYFIDDSLTMREVIRGAFKRENMKVVACPDADTALAQMEETKPDVVITDVIMPGRDGYEVCQFVKQHPEMNAVPVILLSGVVNRDVAQKAFGVKADDLIRKPFLPQELITRVKQLLAPKSSAPTAPVSGCDPTAALSRIFAGAHAARTQTTPAAVAAAAVRQSQSATAAVGSPVSLVSTKSTADVYKLRLEILRLESLVRKLQNELEAEREYGRALDAHLKALQQA